MHMALGRPMHTLPFQAELRRPHIWVAVAGCGVFQMRVTVLLVMAEMMRPSHTQ